MKRTLTARHWLTLPLLLGLLALPAHADEVLKSIQRDLAVLGYDPGPADGVTGIKTQLAIAKFEEANGLPVTGEASLAVAAAASNQAEAKRTGAAPAAAPAALQTASRHGNDLPPAELAARRQACLDQAAQQAREQQQRKQSLRNLATMGARVAGRFSGVNAAEIYQNVQTAEDIAGIANELGLTEAQVAACM